VRYRTLYLEQVVNIHQSGGRKLTGIYHVSGITFLPLPAMPLQEDVHQRIQALTEAIFSIDREIDQHSLSIRKLQAKKARLAVELRNAKATITLARKLPEVSFTLTSPVFD
jgi:hypothetical protein